MKEPKFKYKWSGYFYKILIVTQWITTHLAIIASDEELLALGCYVVTVSFGLSLFFQYILKLLARGY